MVDRNATLSRGKVGGIEDQGIGVLAVLHVEEVRKMLCILLSQGALRLKHSTVDVAHETGA